MAESIEDKMAQNKSKIPYEKYAIWVRSSELKAGGSGPRALVVIPADEGNG